MNATAQAVLWGRLARHPAVEAWNGLSDGPVGPPEHIEILQQSSTSATYRLVADGGGRSIVARRSLTAGASVAPAAARGVSPAPPRPSPPSCWVPPGGTRRAGFFLVATRGERSVGGAPTPSFIPVRLAE